MMPITTKEVLGELLAVTVCAPVVVVMFVATLATFAVLLPFAVFLFAWDIGRSIPQQREKH